MDDHGSLQEKTLKSRKEAQDKQLAEMNKQLKDEMTKIQAGLNADIKKLQAALSSQSKTSSSDLETLRQTLTKETDSKITKQEQTLTSKIQSINRSLGGQYLYCAGNSESCSCEAGRKIRAVYLDQSGYFSVVDKTFTTQLTKCDKDSFGVTSKSEFQFTCYCQAIPDQQVQQTKKWHIIHFNFT